MEGKEKVWMSRTDGVELATGGRGHVGAHQFLSLTCSPALCSSSFHSNCPPDGGAAFYSAGGMDGGGGGESEVTGGVKVQGRAAVAAAAARQRESVNGSTVVKGPSRVTATLEVTLLKREVWRATRARSG